MRKRAPSCRARSSRCRVATEPTRRISIGSSSKSVGLAGEAKCMIASNRAATLGSSGRPSETSPFTSVKSGLSARCATLLSAPVTKLSTATTSAPRPIRVSTRCDGTKPAPPVRRIRCPSPYRWVTAMPVSLAPGGTARFGRPARSPNLPNVPRRRSTTGPPARRTCGRRAPSTTAHRPPRTGTRAGSRSDPGC